MSENQTIIYVTVYNLLVLRKLFNSFGQPFSIGFCLKNEKNLWKFLLELPNKTYNNSLS